MWKDLRKRMIFGNGGRLELSNNGLLIRWSGKEAISNKVCGKLPLETPFNKAHHTTAMAAGPRFSSRP
jgi:hypothetical protein